MPNPSDRPRVVVSVGTDHHRFDRMVTWIDEWCAAHPEVATVIQRGTSTEPTHCPSSELIPHADLLELFAQADAVVSHGGPSTVMDARMVGRFPLVMARNPDLGEHVDGHQLRFADHLRRHGLARVIDTRDDLFAALDEALADPQAFTVPIDSGSISGVVGFGRILDQLLRTSTSLTPATPAGAETAVLSTDD